MLDLSAKQSWRCNTAAPLAADSGDVGDMPLGGGGVANYAGAFNDGGADGANKFRGRMRDLRVFATALAPEDIARIAARAEPSLRFAHA